MMLPAAVGLPMPPAASGVVFCTTCFPKVGLIEPGSSAFWKAREASREAGVVDLPGEIGGGHLGAAGRLALHLAVCGSDAAVRRSRRAYSLLKALLLVDAQGRPTEAGRALAARIGLSADTPPRAADIEQRELPMDLTLRKPGEALVMAVAAPASTKESREELEVEPAQARPFVRWPGGKGKLLPGILAVMPEKFGRLLVPFVGGGALPFAMPGRVAYISDVNTHLINAYKCVRGSVDELMDALQEHKNDREYFQHLRDDFNRGYGDSVWRAAAFIYLNKTCFNGVVRFNKKGEFNVNFGDNPNATLCDEPNLRACSVALRSIEIAEADFRAVESIALPGDFVYLDEPYVPETKTSFTRYTKDGFSAQDHEDVAALFRRLVSRGVHVLASNGDTPKVRELYSGLEVRTLTRSNSVNSKASGRGGKSELLILGGTWTPRGAT